MASHAHLPRLHPVPRSPLPAIPKALRVPLLKAGRVVRRHGLAGKRVLVGASGGPDSSLLVAVMALLAPRVGFSVEAVHVNHQLGPHASTMEQAARDVCERFAVPLHQRLVNVRSDGGLGLEGAAREARHAAFSSLMRERAFDFLATGHTATDVAETFLQRILEGSGRQGALPERDGVKLRPLLELTRDDVRTAVRSAGIPAVHDPMNDDADLLRGYLRSELWPILSSRFGAVDRTLARAALMARQDHDALENWARRTWSNESGLARDVARTLPFAVLTRALRQMVEAAAGMPVRTGAEAVTKCAEAALLGGGPRRRFKAGPVWLTVDRSHVHATKDLDNGDAPSDRPDGAWYGQSQTHGPRGPGKAG